MSEESSKLTTQSNASPLSPDDFNFDKLNRQGTWKDIFDLLDNNFSKVAEYLATLGNRVRIDQFVATAGQTVFELTDKYNTLRNCVSVYVNGARQWKDSGFTESSETSITLTTPCDAGDEVTVVYNKYYIVSDTRKETQCGTTDDISVGTGITTEVSIQFDAEYVEIPTVVCGLVTTINDVKFGSLSCAVVETTTTGFKVRLYNNSGIAATTKVSWIASGT